MSTAEVGLERKPRKKGSRLSQTPVVVVVVVVVEWLMLENGKIFEKGNHCWRC